MHLEIFYVSFLIVEKYAYHKFVVLTILIIHFSDISIHIAMQPSPPLSPELLSFCKTEPLYPLNSFPFPPSSSPWRRDF